MNDNDDSGNVPAFQMFLADYIQVRSLTALRSALSYITVTWFSN